jgi:hypothetical protein
MNRAGAWSPGKCDGIDVEGEPVGNRVGSAGRLTGEGFTM